MAAAANRGARLIHFTEGALSGYAKQQIRHWDKVDWNRLEREQDRVAREAERLGVWTVFGCNHRQPEPQRPHNSMFVVSDRGEVVARYDKRWCSYSELTDWYTPGSEPVVFEVGGWRFGCALCIEIQFPEVFSGYSADDVDCVLFSAYSEDAMFGIQAQAYAATYNYWVSVANPENAGGGLTSRIIGPSGEIDAQCSARTDTFATADLDETDERWHVPLRLAKPWRRRARAQIARRQLANDSPTRKTTGLSP